MIRVNIERKILFVRFIISLTEKGYKITVNNPCGSCFFIRTDGSKRVDLSHWTNDIPILEIGEKEYEWLLSAI